MNIPTDLISEKLVVDLDDKQTASHLRFQRSLRGGKKIDTERNLMANYDGFFRTLVVRVSDDQGHTPTFPAPSGDSFVDHASAYTFENVKLIMRERKMGSLGHGMALSITTGNWEVNVWSKRFPNPAANPGKALLNVAVSATYDADHDVVAPHGLVGQSYDGDGVAVDGNVDDYTGKEVTTQAMAEGAIEGTAAEYKVSGPFATDFKYTRFDATAAKARDVSKLTGVKKVAAKKAGFGTTGATPDVE